MRLVMSCTAHLWLYFGHGASAHQLHFLIAFQYSYIYNLQPKTSPCLTAFHKLEI